MTNPYFLSAIITCVQNANDADYQTTRQVVVLTVIYPQTVKSSQVKRKFSLDLIRLCLLDFFLLHAV